MSMHIGDDGHFIISLCCRRCGYSGVNREGQTDFALLGKDIDGFIFFECPRCHEQNRFDPLAEYESMDGNSQTKFAQRSVFGKTWMQILCLAAIVVLAILYLVLRKT